jgi:hypothetical protein
METLLLTSFSPELNAEVIFPAIQLLFQDEVAKNPMIQNVLVWCDLIGLKTEQECKNEIYNGGNLDPVKLQAATHCVVKSGLKFRAALDKYFKFDQKEQALYSHEVNPIGRHLQPLKDLTWSSTLVRKTRTDLTLARSIPKAPRDISRQGVVS